MRQILKNARILDVHSGEVMNEDVLVIEDGRIVDVTRTVPAGESLDLAGQFLTPGLIDSHVHLVWEGQPDPNQFTISEPAVLTAYRAARSARRNLEGGVTTVRDVGGPDGIPMAIARAEKQGMVQGSRVIACGSPVVQTGGHVYTFSREADGADEVRKAVREQIKAGADAIKLMCSGGAYGERESIEATQMTPEEIATAVDEARRAEKRVAAHALNSAAIQNVLEAGVTTVEHAALLSEQNIETFLKTGAFMIPTLSPYYLMAREGSEGGIPESAVRKSRQVMDAYATNLRHAFSRGVRIALGTDAGSPGIPHPTVPFEALLWQRESGISPVEIMRAATYTAAQALGIEAELGSIETGKIADLVTYAENPFDDVATLHRPQRVFRSGMQVSGSHVVWSAHEIAARA